MTWLFIYAIVFIVITVADRLIKKTLQRESNPIQTADYEIDSFFHRESRDYAEERYKHNLETYHSIRKVAYIALLALFIITALLTSVFITTEKQIGFTELFGKPTLIDSAGLHFKVPFLSTKHINDGTTKGLAIGYNEDTDESTTEDSLMITSDFNFVNIDFYLEYRISDPIEYYYGSNNPEGILKNIAQSAIRNTVGQYVVDSVLTTGKSEIEMAVYADIIAELENHSLGLTVMNVTIQDSEPPTREVNTAFTDVENAKQEAEKVVNEANKYANTQLPAAEAKANAIKQEASAEKTERVNAAKEEVATFNALFEEYKNNPDTVKRRLYYETLEEILPNMEIIISDDSRVVYVSGNSTNSVAAAAAAAGK